MIQYHGWTVVDRENPNLLFERNVLGRFCGGECVSIQEVIERTGIRTPVAEQKQQEVYETTHNPAMSTRVRSKYNTSDSLKDPSHPLCFARFEGDMRHFRCHRNSSFLQCEFKSFYILPNTAHSGLNSPSTRCQTISGFIHWIIYELFVIFRIKSVTQTRECNRTSLRSESQLKQH